MLVLSIPKAPKIIHPVAEMSEPLLIVTSASISPCQYFVSHPANPSCIYSFQDMFNKRLNVFVTMTTYFKVHPIFSSYFDKPRQQYYLLRHDGTTWHTQNWHMINCQLNPYHFLCRCQILTASGFFMWHIRRNFQRTHQLRFTTDLYSSVETSDMRIIFFTSFFAPEIILIPLSH